MRSEIFDNYKDLDLFLILSIACIYLLINKYYLAKDKIKVENLTLEFSQS